MWFTEQLWEIPFKTFIAKTIFIEANNWVAAILLKVASAKDVFRKFIELFQPPNTIDNQLSYICSKAKMVTHRQCVKYIENWQVNNEDTKTMPPISLKYQWRRSDVSVINFEHISHIVLMFLMLTSNK